MGVVYQILNKVNGAVYIGSSSKDGTVRRRRHKKALNENRHYNRNLQKAWNEYGEQSFVFSILEVVPDGENLNAEQRHLDHRKNNYPEHLNYNICWTAGNCSGVKFTEDALRNLRVSHLGIRPSLETRKKQSETWTKKFNRTYMLISPENKEVIFHNARKFCRDNNVHHGGIMPLINGKIHYYKGWSRKDSPTYSFISPTGEIHENIKRLKDLCDKYGLSMKGMSAVHCKSKKSHLGWKLKN